MRGTRKLGPAVLVAAMALAFAGPASAGSGGPVEPDRPAPWEHGLPDDVPVADDLWFVEFGTPPEVEGGTAAARANERARFAAEARARGADYEPRDDYSKLWNGMTVRAGDEDIDRIRQLPSVHRVFPVALIERPEPNEISPALQSALAMTGADVAQSELGYTGDGVAVAIIDTGIDYNHPDLGGDGDDDRRYVATSSDDRVLTDTSTGQTHPRITHGWDYVGQEFNPADPSAPPTPEPDPDPRDTQGHGTHVAGIAGAAAADEDGVTGVAPGVTFGAYKVFGPGSTTADVIVQALEDAYEDGMDVVNMSLGATLAWGQDYPTTAASNRLAADGVVVVNSAGNDGALGAYALSAPANAHDIISVASADNTEQQTYVFEVEQLDAPIPYLPMSAAPAPPTDNSTSDPVVWAGRGCPSLGDTIPAEVAGNTALLVRGDCTFNEKYQAAVAAGATGVVIHNNVAGLFAGGGIDPVEDVWAAGISRSAGLDLRELLDDGEEVVLGFSDERRATPNPTGGLASSFTSYGQDVELAFGPSVMAPGGLIVSTYPLGSGGYAMLSGTSMAAPHVAGAAALLLEADPTLDPFDVRDRLQNTAEPAVWSLNPGLGFLDHTFRQGAGMVQVDRAIASEQRVTPAQLSLGDDAVTTTTLTITNDSDEAVTYTPTHVPALETAGSTFAPGFYLAEATATLPAEVTVPANGQVEVEVTITAPPADALRNHQYGGYLTLLATVPGDAEADVPVEHTTLRVPYSGFAGDYVDEMRVYGYWDGQMRFVEREPRLMRVHRDQLRPVNPNHTFTFRQGNYPILQVFLGHPARELRVTLRHEDGREFVVFDEEYVRRSSSPSEYLSFPITGATVDGQTLPAGRYTMLVEALQVVGDADDASHWDVWESGRIRIAQEAGGPGRG